LGKIGLESESAAKCAGSLGKIFELMQNDAEIVGRVKIVGRDADNSAVFFG
jgi:hypothetical protein